MMSDFGVGRQFTIGHHIVKLKVFTRTKWDRGRQVGQKIGQKSDIIYGWPLDSNRRVKGRKFLKRSSPCLSRFSSVFLEIYSKNIKDRIILNVALPQYLRNFKGPDMGLVASSSRGQFDPLHPSSKGPAQQQLMHAYLVRFLIPPNIEISSMSFMYSPLAWTKIFFSLLFYNKSNFSLQVA